MSEKPPFFTLGSRANEQRVKQLLNSEVYKPISAMITLQKQLQYGTQRRLLDMFWSVAMEAAQTKVKATGYTNAELTAALAVTLGAVVPPK
jgi:hypothetical protein